jgi:hypothetical protein
MTMRPTDDRVVSGVGKAFSAVFGPQLPFNPSMTRINEPQWTSLKHVEFIIALEGEFGVRFDGADATDMTDMQTVIDTVARRLP